MELKDYKSRAQIMVDVMEYERIEEVMQKATDQVAFKIKISKFQDFNCL
ncbi:hypothetical protein HHL20_18105 [Chryseobacterium sp. RJ-7-14]|uniref:Uncharacterized protein n=1 Tax=Chryseobacterium cheonjiense TaxID=2728845 RepID=A0A7Y0FK44_9FLAO|nr:hypothetical protein [Chryseobacterium cheonjiense]